LKHPVDQLDRVDAWIAALCGIGALAVYVRTMAPDLLYGDSAELQTLAHTLGHTHSTGYPIYLLLAHLVGSLPLHTPAWRVTLFSALSAASAVAGVYLLSRMLTSSRAGALRRVLAWRCPTRSGLRRSSPRCMPWAVFLAWILFLVCAGIETLKDERVALWGGALAGLSLECSCDHGAGGSAGAGFVLLGLIRRGEPGGSGAAPSWRGGGAILGVALWLAAFLTIDWHDRPRASSTTGSLAIHLGPGG
jgi:hypothetical protein